MTEQQKELLLKVAERIYKDSAGSAFWDEDKERLDCEELGDYLYGDYPSEEVYTVTTAEECNFILEQLYAMCDMCACCGWIWWQDDLDEHEGELLCSNCIEDA